MTLAKGFEIKLVNALKLKKKLFKFVKYMLYYVTLANLGYA